MRLNTGDSKKKQYHYYATRQEAKQINELALRINKPTGTVVKICALSVANDPSLDYIFNSNVRLKPEDVKLRKLMYTHIDSILHYLQKEGIDIDAFNDLENANYITRSTGGDDSCLQ